MKGPVFKLNMHPKEFFDRNPFLEDGKGGRRRGENKERSKSAPNDRKTFKFSSPGKKVLISSTKLSFFLSCSSVEIKTVVSINFPNEVTKILT